MEIMEIILLIAGGAIFTLSFFIPDKKGASGNVSAREDVKALVEQELATVDAHVESAVEEAVTYALERTERSLEKLSNEKIMAVSEYSDTVLGEIHKNHEEVMFLYDMLNNKHISLKNAMAEVNRTVKEAQDAMEAFRKLADDRAMPETAQESEDFPLSEEPDSGSMTEEAPEGLTADRSTEGYREDGEPGRNNNERIMALYRQGKSAKDIARELELGVGEVKLVIGLFRD